MFDENLYKFATAQNVEVDLQTIKEGQEGSQTNDAADLLPILPLRNTVLFPKVIAPITVGRETSMKAIDYADKNGKWLLVAAQKDADTNEPQLADLHPIVTLAKVIRTLRTPDDNVMVILQGRQRAQINTHHTEQGFLMGTYQILEDIEIENEVEMQALMDSVKEISAEIVELSPNIPKEANDMLQNIDNQTFLFHFVAANLNITVAQKQQILDINELKERAMLLLNFLNSELNSATVREEIENKVRTELDKQQREFILNQHLKTIQEELSQSPQQQDIDELQKAAALKKWSEPIKTRFEKELAKLKRLNPAIPDYAIALNYLELMVELPWNEYTEDNFDLPEAENILNRDHFGLDKVKDRILEYLAVLKLRNDMKAPILCLFGPPGVGKTSLGKSIAEALGRKYIRMSLGGLSDEAELRGHRKTYIGALAGRIIQSIKKAGSSNPVFILDEIDKLGNSYKGDPSSALLEILDPEQNTAFYDNYLEVEFDLSKVLFIATANNLNTVQYALLDRMELIEVNGYSVEEKVAIAKKHLIPKLLDNHGLSPEHLQIPDATLTAIARDYTRESGVRSLEREMAKLMRWVARKVATDADFKTEVSETMLETILGSKKVQTDMYEETQRAGVAVGLAWTAVGGDILFIEASASKGKGNLTLTGNLGEVMKESATTALAFLRANAQNLGLDYEKIENTNLHIHVPAGAIPKDGPSAGITMMSAIYSVLTEQPLRPRLAMTGEISLRGKVLPVGGIKEKVLAAKRAGVTDIILCVDNQADIKEIKPDYLEGLTFHYVKTMQEVLNLAFPKP
jgi:ATP-dependent Lon protease